MAAPVLLTHESSLRHDPGPHPERAARIVAIERELEVRGGLGWERRESPAADMEALLAVHPEEHVRFVRELCAAGGGMIDADTFVSADSYEAALHAAGGAVEACSTARRRARSPPTGRPGTTPSLRARWASACSRTSRSRRGGPWRAAAPSA